MSKIFVSIAAYNEPDLELTIQSALENATEPERIHFGIVSHYTDGNRPNLSKYDNVKVIGLDYNSQSFCPLNRLLAISLMKDETYYLQIDAHMLFEPGWDSYLVYMYEKIITRHGPSVISSYLPPWHWSEDGEIVALGTLEGCKLSVTDDMHLNTDQRHPMAKSIAGNFEFGDYGEHFLMSGHFIFANAEYTREVSPDPFIVFAGEEPTLAIRTYTHGYKIFAIKNNVIRHKTKEYGLKYSFDWRQDKRFNDTEGLKTFYYNTDKSICRVAEILNGDWFGYYGAKDLESYNDYCDKLGSNLKDLYKKIFELANTDKDLYQGAIGLQMAYFKKERDYEEIH
jgi:hypothetical protein